VILVFTKFDIVVSQVLSDIALGDARRYEGARAMAHAMYEDSCRRLFRKGPRDVPAEIVSGTHSLFSMGGHLTSPIVLRQAEIRKSC
jgi:hypothetical protein